MVLFQEIFRVLGFVSISVENLEYRVGVRIGVRVDLTS